MDAQYYIFCLLRMFGIRSVPFRSSTIDRLAGLAGGFVWKGLALVISRNRRRIYSVNLFLCRFPSPFHLNVLGVIEDYEMPGGSCKYPT